MEQTLDLARMTLDSISGEHFLTVEASDSLATVMDRLRDHQCAAAIYPDGSNWCVVSAEVLPDVLCKGPAALHEPVSSVAQTLLVLSASDMLPALTQALHSHTWVGVLRDGRVVNLLHWTSWARFTAQRRVAGAYRFSPEWGRTDIPMAKVV